MRRSIRGVLKISYRPLSIDVSIIEPPTGQPLISWRFKVADFVRFFTLARCLLLLFAEKGVKATMSKGKQAEIELPSILKPLEPVGERVTKKQKSEYARLLAEYERIDEIRDSQVKGASLSFDKEKKPYRRLWPLGWLCSL